jgi:hypothetical protein
MAAFMRLSYIPAYEHNRPVSRTMKWVTRVRPRIDRVACAWAIKRFVDPEPEFLFVPNEQVFEVAEREGATPFHVRGGKLGRTPDETGFDALVRYYDLAEDDAALAQLARIIHGADVFGADAPPESAGVRAIMNGYVDAYADDQELTRVAATVYEALYQWCRRQNRAVPA